MLLITVVRDLCVTLTEQSLRWNWYKQSFPRASIALRHYFHISASVQNRFSQFDDFNQQNYRNSRPDASAVLNSLQETVLFPLAAADRSEPQSEFSAHSVCFKHFLDQQTGREFKHCTQQVSQLTVASAQDEVYICRPHVRRLENKRRQEALPWRWGRSSCSSRWWPPADRRETAPRSRTWTWSRAGKQKQQYTPVSMHQLTISHLVVLNTHSGDYSLNSWVKCNSETPDASLSSCLVISLIQLKLKELCHQINIYGQGGCDI